MKNSLIIFLLILSISNLEARYKEHITKQLKGQEYYLSACASCHGDGNRGGNLYSIREWKKIFAANGRDLIELHDGEEDTNKIIEYIKSKEFKKESSKMLKFIQEFAYDSDTIPTCN